MHRLLGWDLNPQNVTASTLQVTCAVTFFGNSGGIRTRHIMTSTLLVTCSVIFLATGVGFKSKIAWHLLYFWVALLLFWANQIAFEPMTLHSRAKSADVFTKILAKYHDITSHVLLTGCATFLAIRWDSTLQPMHSREDVLPTTPLGVPGVKAGSIEFGQSLKIRKSK